MLIRFTKPDSTKNTNFFAHLETKENTLLIKYRKSSDFRILLKYFIQLSIVENEDFKTVRNCE